MLKFKIFFEQFDLYEATEKQKSAGSKADEEGKLHELLVGYHLNGGKHLEQHADKDGLTPKQVHDNIKKTFTPEEYKNANEKAKSAANDIQSKVEVGGHKVSKVHWTSKPGDIERSTGIASTQKQDASDLVVHTTKGKRTKFHGVSLKVTKSSSKQVPVANPGIESTLGGNKIHESHKKAILQAHPKLASVSNAAARKAILKTNPKMQADISERNKKALTSIAKNLHSNLSSMKSEDVATHIKNHVLQSNPTPMQSQGHNHIRHTTYVSRGQIQHHSIDPSTHFEHILNDHRNINMEHSGTNVHFYHTDPKTGKKIKFASHRVKFSSQSDPLSSIKSSGIAHI
jgi:hypothetical protein